MGSFKDRGGKTTLSDTVGAIMGFLRFEMLILSAAVIIGQLGNFLFRGHRLYHS